MSDTILRFIPSDAQFVPAPEDQQEALEIFGSSFPKADEIKISVYRDTLFFDQGGNFERIKCPNCDKELDNEWFGKAMDRAYQKKVGPEDQASMLWQGLIFE